MPRMLSNLALFTLALLTFLVASVVLSATLKAQGRDKGALREAACAHERTAAEREICLDKDLTRRDALLNEVYQELRGLLSKSDFKNLRTEQRAWLKQRNRCGSKTKCLANHYEDRVAVLEQMIESANNPNKSHVEIGCDGPGQTYINGECINSNTSSNDDLSPDSDRTWYSTSYNDDNNKGRFTTILRHGIPETDDVSFEATCTAGSSGTFATTVIGYNTDALKEGTNVVLDVATTGYRSKFNGEVYGEFVEEGVTGVLLRPDVNDLFWEALASGSTLTYKAANLSTASMNLKGSGTSVRNFIKTCKSIKNADNGSSRGPKLSTKNKTCEKFGSIKSKNSKTPVEMTFVNKTDGHRAVMWINFEGTPVDYAALNPGESFSINTYLTHPWMFTDGPGNCIEMVLPKVGVSVFKITAKSPFSGPEYD